MYEHNQDYFGGFRGFWKVPEVSSSLVYWSRFALLDGEHLEANADDHAGVSAIEIQRDAHLE